MSHFRGAPHLTGTDVSYETVLSRHLVDEHDAVAKPLEASDVMAAKAIGVGTIEGVRPEIVVRNTLLEDVPQRNNNGVLHGDDSLLRPGAGSYSMEKRVVVALLGPRGGPGRLLQRRTKPRRPLPRARRVSLSPALVIAGTQACPRRQVRSRREATHVDARSPRQWPGRYG